MTGGSSSIPKIEQDLKKMFSKSFPVQSPDSLPGSLRRDSLGGLLNQAKVSTRERSGLGKCGTENADQSELSERLSL